MSARRIFCEGPDDRSALRELNTRGGFGRTKDRTVSRSSTGPDRGDVFKKEGSEDLELTVAGDKERVFVRALDLAFESASPSDPLTMVGLSFDPDDEAEPRWRRRIENAFSAWAPVRETGGDGYILTGPFAPIVIVPLPWSMGAKPHAALPDKHCLERVAGHSLSTVHVPLAKLVDKWLAEARDHGRAPSWKMAARFWNGLVLAEVSGAAFFDKVFGQERSLGEACRNELAGSMLWRGLELLCR